MMKFYPKYIVDDTGKKTGVVLDIVTFEAMVETLEDFFLGLEAAQEIAEEMFIDFDETNKKILKNGTL